MAVKVVKFGGSSLADAEHFRLVASIIKSDPQRRYAIPSAPGKRFPDDTKVTDMLYQCYEMIRSRASKEEIEDDVEIGSCAGVDKSQMGSTIIRQGCKIDNHCQIAHNVEVGKNTVMAAMCGIAGSAKLGEHCILGGQAGVAGHITVADNTQIGGQSGLLKSVKTPGQQFFGTPALPYMDYMRSYAVFKKNGKQ